MVPPTKVSCHWHKAWIYFILCSIPLLRPTCVKTLPRINSLIPQRYDCKKKKNGDHFIFLFITRIVIKCKFSQPHIVGKFRCDGASIEKGMWSYWCGLYYYSTELRNGYTRHQFVCEAKSYWKCVQVEIHTFLILVKKDKRWHFFFLYQISSKSMDAWLLYMVPHDITI